MKRLLLLILLLFSVSIFSNACTDDNEIYEEFAPPVYNVFIRGNTFYMIRQDGVEYEGAAKEVLVTRYKTTSTDFYFKNVNGFPSRKVNISQLKKEDGTPYTLQEFVDFKDGYTGGAVSLNTLYLDPSKSTAELQAEIDANTKPIVIGHSINDVYTLKKALTFPSNTEIIINGTVKRDAPKSWDLTQNFVAGDKTLMVDNSDGYLEVGMELLIYSDDSPIQAGGSWKTAKLGAVSKIESVTATSVTFKETLAQGRITLMPANGYQTASNAKFVQYHSLMFFDTKNNIKITGTGQLLGGVKDAGREDVIGIDFTMNVEAIFSGCGISFKDCNGVTIQGTLADKFKVKDALLHNIAFGSTISPPYIKNKNILIEDVLVDRPLEKNIAFLSCDDAVVRRVTNSNGINEGEIICYQNNTNFEFNDITSINNRRFGLAIGNTNTNIKVFNHVARDNDVADFNAKGMDGQLTFDGGTYTSPNSTSSANILLSDMKNLNMSNITMNAGGHGYAFLSMARCQDVVFDNITMKGNTTQSGVNGSTMSKSISLQDNTNITVQNFSISDVRKVVVGGGTNTNIVFKNGDVGYRSLEGSDITAGMTYLNVTDSKNNTNM